MNRIKLSFLVVACMVVTNYKAFSQDKNFYIFLSFGQSNMEGNAKFEPQDTVNIDSGFQVLEARFAINVSMRGCKIELFNKDHYES